MILLLTGSEPATFVSVALLFTLLRRYCQLALDCNSFGCPNRAFCIVYLKLNYITVFLYPSSATTHAVLNIGKIYAQNVCQPLTFSRTDKQSSSDIYIKPDNCKAVDILFGSTKTV